jgi:uncharacterized membrane protein
MFFSNLQKWWTQYAFTLAFCLGVAFIVLIPPFQTPDEDHHYLRIQHIVNGHLWGEVSTDKQRLGGNVAAGLSKVYEPFMGITFDRRKKIQPQLIFDHLNTPLSNSTDSFIAFPNTARYPPTAYLPQVVGIGVSKILGLPPLWAFYLARLSALIGWLLLIRWAIRTTPVYKKLLFVLALLPASLAVNTTLSADVFSNGLAFILIAFCLKMRYFAKISHRDTAIFTVLSLLITWQKIVYAPLFLLLILVPKNAFLPPLSKIRVLSIGLALHALLVFWWVGKVDKMVYPTNDIHQTTYKGLREDVSTGNEVNPRLQTQRIISDPILFAKNFIPATFSAYQISFPSYLSSFGWEYTLPPSGLQYILMGFLFVFVSIQQRFFTGYETVFLALVAHAMTCLFILSQHLHWDEVGDYIIDYYGGKYYVPIYPLWFLALAGFLGKWRDWVRVKLKFEFILGLFFTVLYIDVLILIVERYYLPNH